MEIRELRSLLYLADLGSLAKTADKLHLTSPAIHKHLKLLEDELGVQLYERVGRNLRLTQAAYVLLPRIRNMLIEYDAAIQELEEVKGLRRGLVRIGAGPTFSSYVLPLLLEEFRRQHSEVELFVETGHTPQLLDDLNKGALDLAIIVGSELTEQRDFEVRQAWDFDFVLTTPMQQLPRRCSLAKLQAHPFILYRKGSVMENQVDRYFATHRFRPRVVMRLDNAEAIKAMVKSGLGISLLPLWTVADEVKQRKLAIVRLQETPPTGRLVLVTRKSGHLPHSVEAFIEAAQKWHWKSA
jgi:DNA-binding transcriptional LysR family regulator